MRESLLTVRLYKRGEVTVFLSLICLVTIVFIGAIVSSAKIVAARNGIELLTKTAVTSAFSEYDKTLFDTFGLLFVDTTYKGICDGGDDSFSEHVTQYIDVNINDTLSKFLDINYLSISISDSEYADANYYYPLRQQIREYMTKSKGYSDDLDDEEMLDAYVTEIDVCGLDDASSNCENQNMVELIINHDEDSGEEDSINKLDSLTYDEKLNVLVKFIESYIQENSNGYFNFSKQMQAATVTVYFESGTGKVYECKKEYSLLGR